ncbi:MAG: aromatic amino acid lyase, partial [Kribbellaceae bacterium]
MDIPDVVTVGVGPLSPEDVVAVARYGAPVRLDDQALEQIAKSRAAIEALAHAETPHYGVSTGFGALA